MGRIKNAWDALRGKAVADGGQINWLLPEDQRFIPRRGTSETIAAYNTMPFLRAVMHRVASTTASVPLYAVRAQRGKNTDVQRVYRELKRYPYEERMRAIKRMKELHDLEEAVDSPVTRILEKPNPRMSGRQFLFLTQTHIDLGGTAYWLPELTRRGRIGELWLGHPKWIVRAPDAYSDEWEFRGSGIHHVSRVGDAHEPILLKDPDPNDPYGQGYGLGRVLSNELDADESASLAQIRRFQNGGSPELLISILGSGKGAGPGAGRNMSNDAIDRIAADWNGRFRGETGSAHFTNLPIDVKQLSYTFADLQLLQLREFERNTIIQVVGVPPEIFGIIANSNRATSEAAKFHYAEWVIVPRLELMISEMETWLLPKIDDRVMLTYESPVPDDREFKLRAMQAATWVYDMDEWRAIADNPPSKNSDAGELHAIPMGVTLAKLDELVAPEPDGDVIDIEPDTTEDGVGTAEGADPSEDTGEGANAPPAPSQGGSSGAETGDKAADPAWVRDLSDSPPRACHECGEPFTVKRYDAQNGYCSACIDKTTDPRILALMERLKADRLTKPLEHLWSPQLKKWMQRQLTRVGADVSFDILNPLVEEHLRQLSGTRITGLVNNHTREQLRNSLLTGIQQGEGAKQLSKRVREVFQRKRLFEARRIARTETTRSANYGSVSAYDASGLVEQKEWIGTPDGEAREDHDPLIPDSLHGQRVGVREMFTVQRGGSPDYGATAAYPGDFAVASQVVNCRCATMPVVDSKSEMDRLEVWKEFDKFTRDWENKATRVLREGFSQQEIDLVSAVAELFGDE